MGRKRRKPVVEQAEQPLPRNKQILEMLLSVVQQFLNEQNAYQARQEVRLRHMRDLLGSPKTAVPRQQSVSELRDIAINRASVGLADISAVEPYFLNSRIRKLLEQLADAHAALANSLRHRTTPATVDQFEQLLALQSGMLAEYRAFRDRLIGKLKNKRADNNSDMHKKIVRIIPDENDFMEFCRELDEHEGESSQIQIAIGFTGGDETRADSLLRKYRRFKAKVAAQIAAPGADMQKVS